MEVFTLSAFETSAEAFFTTLRRRHADLVLDVRLRNTNQLCGFTKKKDLEFLVPALTGAAYRHDLQLAPSPGLLDAYRHKDIPWETYRTRYRAEMEEAGAVEHFHKEYGRFHCVCILGTATAKRRSHSEVLAELV